MKVAPIAARGQSTIGGSPAFCPEPPAGDSPGWQNGPIAPENCASIQKWGESREPHSHGRIHYYFTKFCSRCQGVVYTKRKGILYYSTYSVASGLSVLVLGTAHRSSSGPNPFTQGLGQGADSKKPFQARALFISPSRQLSQTPEHRCLPAKPPKTATYRLPLLTSANSCRMISMPRVRGRPPPTRE